MRPSLRSHPNHPQQPVSPPWTRDVGGNGRRSCGRLRQSLEGSPLLQTESGSLVFGTAGPPRAALHPVSRRRSCLRLLSRCSSRDDSDFHWLISCMCARTSGGIRPPCPCAANEVRNPLFIGSSWTGRSDIAPPCRGKMPSQRRLEASVSDLEGQFPRGRRAVGIWSRTNGRWRRMIGTWRLTSWDRKTSIFSWIHESGTERFIHRSENSIIL